MLTRFHPFLLLMARLLCCLLVLGGGVYGFKTLKNMKQPPARVAPPEPSLPVRVIEVRPMDHSPQLTGLGTLQARQVVRLSNEVSGRVVRIHPRLEEGEIIQKGAVLVALDARVSQLALKTAKTSLQLLTREAALAKQAWTRLEQLYQANRATSLSVLEQSESAYHRIQKQINEGKRSLESAQLALERCTLKAPFTGRLTAVKVEKEEYLSPGQHLVTLSDDSDLEVKVGLSSEDGFFLLEKPAVTALPTPAAGWFARPEQVVATVRWSGNPAIQGRGYLDRIVAFEVATRTLTLAIRLQPQSATAFPLVPGMFCEVTLPGPVLKAVFYLPPPSGQSR